MSNEWGAQSGIYVEETQTYDIALGRQTLSEWSPDKSLLTVRVHLPYDGQNPFDEGRQLKDVRTGEDVLKLGQIEIDLPGAAHTTRVFTIGLPAGADLARHLKSNHWVGLPRNMPL